MTGRTAPTGEATTVRPQPARGLGRRPTGRPGGRRARWRGGRRRQLVAVLAGMLTALALGTAGARVLGLEYGPLAVVVAATPYALVLSGLGLALALLARLPRWSVVAVLALAALGATQARLWVPDAPAPPPRGASGASGALTVMTTNLQYGRGDAGQVVAEVRRRGVDVLAVQELPASAVEALGAAGLDALLPHRYVRADAGPSGSGLWSRHPLADERQLEGFRSVHLSARLRPAEGSAAAVLADVTVVVVHPARPAGLRHGHWQVEHRRLRSELTRLPGTVVAVGDFNATPDHVAMRRLGAGGYRNARDAAGAGYLSTWPVGRGLPAPLFAIDHVLLRGPLTATGVDVVRISSTDHAALVAQLAPAERA